jgi:acyl carrier protein
MNQRQEIFNYIVQVLKNDCEVDRGMEITEDLMLQDQLNLDSVGLLTLASTLENHFKILLTNELGQGQSVKIKDLVDFIGQELQAQETKIS